MIKEISLVTVKIAGLAIASFAGLFLYLGISSFLGRMQNVSIKFEFYDFNLISSSKNYFLNSTLFFFFSILSVVIFFLIRCLEIRIKKEL